jgi:chromosome segregation ATPase
MTDLLSPSPYAYLDALTPAERQAAIARRQHERREDGCDDARRARDYQAENAALKDDMHAVFGNACDQRDAAIQRLEKALEEGANRREERDAALARIAELEAALEDTEAALQPFVDPVESARGTALHRIATDALLKAAAALRNRI